MSSCRGKTRSGYPKAETYREFESTIASKRYERCCVVLAELACTADEWPKLAAFSLDLYLSKYACGSSAGEVARRLAVLERKHGFDLECLRALCGLAMTMACTKARDLAGRMDAVANASFDVSSVRFDDVGFMQAFRAIMTQALECRDALDNPAACPDCAPCYSFLYCMLVKGSVSRALRAAFTLSEATCDRFKLGARAAQDMRVGPRQRALGAWIVWRLLLYRAQSLSTAVYETVKACYDIYRYRCSVRAMHKRRPLLYVAVRACVEPASATALPGPAQALVESACQQIHLLKAQVEEGIGNVPVPVPEPTATPPPSDASPVNASPVNRKKGGSDKKATEGSTSTAPPWYMRCYTRYDNATRLGAYQDRRRRGRDTFDDPRARSKAIVVSDFQEDGSAEGMYSHIFKI